MKVNKIYKRGNRPYNEDAYTINHSANIFAVMDGATGLGGVPGYIASQTVKKELDFRDTEISLLQRIERANKLLKKENNIYLVENRQEIPPSSTMPKSHHSSTGIAAIQLDVQHHFFEYAHAADCMIFLQYENGEVRTLTHDVVQYLDGQAIAEIIQLQDGSQNIESLVEKIKPLLKNNRQKANTSEGYSVIDGTPEAMEHLEYGRISLKRVQKILLLSDGLQMPMQQGQTNTWENAAEIACNQGIEKLYEIVDEKELQDPNCTIYPRLKTQDDKTAILLEL